VSKKPKESSSQIPNPLCEVFGYPTDIIDSDIIRQRTAKLCPFGNGRSIHCTKSKAEDPIGVCSIIRNGIITITCPIRFRQKWLIGNHAAAFFFPGISNPDFRVLTEVKLDDAYGNRVGNIDVVVVRLEQGKIVDYGALEIQGTYISGNVTKPFRQYMQNQVANAEMTWTNKGAPRADYLSSSRKRLAPQLRYKGYILNRWGRKLAVVVDRPFFNELRRITPFEMLLDSANAEIAWFVYELQRQSPEAPYELTLVGTVFSDFAKTLERINTPIVGNEQDFVRKLQTRLESGEFFGTPEEVELIPDVDNPVNFDTND
jgi:Restriction endonuclease NotI